MARFRFGSRSRRPMGPGGRVASGLIGCVVMIAVSIGAWDDYAKADSLGDRGQKTEGQVVSTRMHRGRKSSSDDYYVTASFTLPDGKSVSGEREVSEACYNRYRQASQATPMPTTVVFDPADTGNWHPADDLDQKQSSAGWMLFLFPVLAVGALGLAAWGVFELVKGKSSASPYPLHGYPPGHPPVSYPQQGYQPPPQPYPQQYPQQRPPGT